MKSKPGPAENAAADLTKQNMAIQNEERGKLDPTLDWFGGPADQSPVYKSFLTTGRQSTARAYDAAKSSVMGQARAAGFGYEQPITQGAGAGMEQAEASDMAALPREALSATIPFQLQAAGIREGEINSFNPNPSLNTWSGAEQQRQARQSAMWQNLARMGVGIGTSFIPGATA